MEDKALARTFEYQGQDQIQVEIIMVSKALGLCKCVVVGSVPERVLVRHKRQLTDLNDAAKALLER